MEDWHGLLDWSRKWTKSEQLNTEAWYYLGLTYSKLERYNDAIEAFRQALRIDPEYAKAWYNLGNTYDAIERHNEAIEAYRQAIRINPDYAIAWYNLGTVYGKNLNRYNDAIEAFRQALRINPDYAIAWYNGYAYSLSGNRSAALKAVQELRRLDPAQADDLFNFIVPR